MTINRRKFLASSGATLAFAGLPSFGALSNQLTEGRLAVIILEGGLDGLCTVQPIGDKHLFDERRSLISDKPLMVNDSFGINPQLSNFAKMMLQNEAIAVHATSMPYTKRSHFEGQNIMESGVTEPFSSSTGWLGRSLSIVQTKGRALSLDMPLILRGYDNVENIYPSDIQGVDFADQNIVKLLQKVSDPQSSMSLSLLENALGEGLYAGGPRDARGLAQTAGKAMSAPDGPIAAVVRVPEFDTHASQDVDSGILASQLGVVDSVFAAFKAGLGEKWKDTVVMTLTEFGRTVRQNGSSGTDHGYGTVGLIAGGLVGKGKVVADWPGLSRNKQFQTRDLMATIDYRSVCAACLSATFGLNHETVASEVFFDKKIPNINEHLFS